MNICHLYNRYAHGVEEEVPPIIPIPNKARDGRRQQLSTGYLSNNIQIVPFQYK